MADSKFDPEKFTEDVRDFSKSITYQLEDASAAFDEIVKKTKVWSDFSKRVEASQQKIATSNRLSLDLTRKIANAENHIKTLMDKGRQKSPYFIGNKEIFALQKQTNELKRQQGVISDTTKSDKDKTKNLEMQAALYNGLLKPVIGDSKEFDKLMELGMGIVEGIATGNWVKVIEILLEAAISRWIELDRAAGEFRRLTGLITPEMGNISQAAREINVQLAYVGVTLEKAYAAAASLYRGFQTSALVAKDMVMFSAKMAANVGLSTDDIGEFEAKFSQTAKSAGTTAENVIYAATALSSMAGVAPKEVMNDIAKASDRTLMFLAKSPMQLMRTAVEARRLGTTLGNLSDSAKGLLNYTTSMEAELAASALLNKNISFQLSRQLAWEGKLQESRNEALRQISSMGDFTKLTIYQQEALATASGMTVGEIIKQQNQQKALNALKSSGNKEDQDTFASYQAMIKSIKANDEDSYDALVKRGREMAKQQMMQYEMEKASNALKAAWVDISDALMPIVQVIMPIILTIARVVGWTFKIIGAVVSGMLAPIMDMCKSIGRLTGESVTWESIMAKISEGVQSIVPMLKLIGSLLVFPLWLSAKFFDIIVSIGQGISSISDILYDALVKPFADAWQPIADFWSGNSPSKLGMTIVKGISSIGGMLFDALISPFADAWHSIADFWSGNSPSKLGMTIVKGISSIGGMLFDTLISPFADAWHSIADFWSGNSPSKLGMTIVKGISSIGGMLFDTLISPFADAWHSIADFWSGNSPSKLGMTIVKGISSIGGMLFDTLISPFADAWHSIADFWSGNSPSKLGMTIVKGISSIGGMLFDTLISPFTKAWNFLKGLPPVGKLFGMAQDAASAVTNQVQTSVETAVNSVVEIKNLDDLRDVISKLTDALNRLAGGGTAPMPLAGPAGNSNQALIDKFDELIGLLKAGGVAVNLDGRKVSSAMSPAGR